MTNLPAVPAAKRQWSRGKKAAVGTAGTLTALWAMGTISNAVGPDTITETVTETVVSTVTETPSPVTETVVSTVTEVPAAPITETVDTETVAPAPITTPSRPTYYSSCADVKAAGAAPLHRGDPGYSSALDRDGDGIACEK